MQWYWSNPLISLQRLARTLCYKGHGSISDIVHLLVGMHV